MTRVPAFPFRIIVKSKRGDNGAALPDRHRNCATLAGVIEARADFLKQRGVYKIETWVCIDETTPAMEQTEPLRETQTSRGSNERHVAKEERQKR